MTFSTPTRLPRRRLLTMSALGIGAAAFGKHAFAAAAPLKAVVRMAGKTYEFREENGTALGDFVSLYGGFTQGCTRVRISGFPLTVFFRPDRDSARVEVVFELGGVFNTIPAHLGAYSVAISRGATVLATVDVPQHYWFSRWRWQSEERPVRADIDSLIAQGLLPPYDRSMAVVPKTGVVAATITTATGALACPVPDNGPDTDVDMTNPGASTTVALPYIIMGLAGITPYMPQTGERPDIGLVTEPQAEYICTMRQTALGVVRNQAEAAGSVPWHIRDETTDAPIDLRARPEATWYDSTTKGNPYVKTVKSAVTVDSAHQPALAYLPYLLTGDPYHLEDLQFQANWTLGALTPEYRMSVPQARAFAWGLRSLAQCARITPDKVPSWILPKTYWNAFLTDKRRTMESDYVASAARERAVFRTTRVIESSGDEGPTAPKGTWTSTWEDDFVTSVLGWVVSMGFSEWRPMFEWAAGSVMARTSPTSGWKRAYASPYRMILRESATAPVVASWAEAWALTQRLRKLALTDPNTWVEADKTYLTYSRGALVFIDKLKPGSVTENLAWASGQLNRNWNMSYKWRLGKGLA